MTFTPDIIPLSTPLQPGQGTCVTVAVTYTNGTPTNICFRIGAHTTNFVQCCAVPHCLSLPSCCAYIFKETLVPNSTQPNCYNYIFTIKNLTVPPVPVQYILLIPDPPNNCFSFSPDIIYLSTPLQPGQSITELVKVCFTQPCHGPFCFFVSIHDTNFNKCCAAHHCLPPFNHGVNMRTPANDSAFPQASNIQLSATADQTLGIQQIAFYANTTLVATATSPGSDGSFAAVWSNAPPGIWNLTAAGSSGGTAGAWISDPVTILVYSNSPSGSSITSPLVSNGILRFSVKTEPGMSCSVECTESLISPNWRVIQTIVGDGSVVTVSDAVTNAPQRYYRVRMN